MNNIIDFRPLDTVSRDDDEAWNAMKLYGESDSSESKSIRQEPNALIKRLKKTEMGAKLVALMNVA